MKYRVYLSTAAEFFVDVEADDEDEAVDLAFDNVPDPYIPSLELGDWEFLDIEEAVNG